MPYFPRLHGRYIIAYIVNCKGILSCSMERCFPAFFSQTVQPIGGGTLDLSTENEVITTSSFIIHGVKLEGCFVCDFFFLERASNSASWYAILNSTFVGGFYFTRRVTSQIPQLSPLQPHHITSFSFKGHVIFSCLGGGLQVTITFSSNERAPMRVLHSHIEAHYRTVNADLTITKIVTTDILCAFIIV